MPDAIRARQEMRQPADGNPRLTIIGLIARQAGKGAILWGAAFGIVVIASLYGFLSAYPTTEVRMLLANTLGANAGLQALMGESKSIDTAGGFVEWRSLGILTFVGAIWALLAGTRLLRGEEEAGRWEILLSGQTTRRRATVSALAGLGISLAGLFAITGVLTVAAGRYPGADFPLGGSLYLALTLTGNAWVCMAVAALTSQLAPTRRAAATWASGAFGLMFLSRAIADSSVSLHWLRLLTPLGWIEELHPLTGGSPIMLIPPSVLHLPAFECCHLSCRQA